MVILPPPPPFPGISTPALLLRTDLTADRLNDAAELVAQRHVLVAAVLELALG